jgi:hypothetical protein
VHAVTPRRRHALGWLAFAAVALVSVSIGLQVGALERKPNLAGAVLQLLGAYGVLALVVERTLEVFIGAWRGRVTGQLFVAVESARRRLEAAPNSYGRQQAVEENERSLADYRAQTQRIALRAGVLLGVLIAATGIRTLDLLVATPSAGAPLILFTMLDLLVTAGMIGGGSDAVHKLMSAVTGFLDVTRSAQSRLAVSDAAALRAPTDIPPVTPGPLQP